MSKHGPNKTEQRKNSRVQHDMMVNHRRSDKAYAKFKAEPYQVMPRGKQVERTDVLGYLDKHGLKGEMQVGQDNNGERT